MDLAPLPQDGRLGPPKPKVWLCNGSCHVPFNPSGQQEKPVKVHIMNEIPADYFTFQWDFDNNNLGHGQQQVECNNM